MPPLSAVPCRISITASPLPGRTANLPVLPGNRRSESLPARRKAWRMQPLPPRPARDGPSPPEERPERVGLHGAAPSREAEDDGALPQGLFAVKFLIAEKP